MYAPWTLISVVQYKFQELYELLLLALSGERKDTVADGFGVEEGSDDSEEECDGKESSGDDFTEISASSKCKNKGT